MAKGTPLAIITLSEQELIGTYAGVMPIVMEMLQSFHPETPVTHDDVDSFFGLCVGALIDHDSRLTTPRDMRLGSETAGARATVWVKRFREMHGTDGSSFLAYAMKGAGKSALSQTPHVHGPDCQHH